MKWIIASLVGAAVLFALFDTGLAIRCYECNSWFQQDCADFFHNKTFNLEQCADGVTMCRKIVQEVYFDKKWDVRYIRQCAPSGEVGGDDGRQCTERTGTKKVKVRYCHCDNQNGCNGAEAAALPRLMLVLPALATLGLMLRKL